MHLRSATPATLSALILLPLLPACSVNNAGPSAGPGSGGQLITATMIQQSGLSTGWDVLRRFGQHLSISEHETGPVRVSRRGRESIYLPENPLLVIDGVKVRNFRVLASLPARDIESMRILSGSEASVAHGMYAASGVIIVRTMHPDPAANDTTTSSMR